MIPLWVPAATLAAFLIAFMPVYQERVKADGFTLAFWNKVFCTLWATPVAIAIGLPDNPVFYAYMAGGAVLWCISDVIYFRAVPQIGAGVMTRLLPAAMVVTFLLWFVFDPALLQNYLAQPALFAGICAMILLAAFSASCLRRCHVSMQAIRLIWFILVAASIGPVITKLGLAHVDTGQGPFATLAVQSAFMVVFWMIWYGYARPVPLQTLLNRRAFQDSFVISLLSGSFVLLKTYALGQVENPAYVSVLLFTDVFWVLVIYKFLGRKEEANVLAGLGIVASAVGLVIIKSLA